ncbi:hypothetical protein CORC01_01374 [Colletotrichum orchidophilum]|uniref:Uncharacterized protein n=1 Tax=Colletotrichum orchidophilum TaxID=1209926 RepID=A0A1G4BPD3_9PEZI|nr:uncharacterized protein CORC01_01374 [Colletotrichum orchidophilum]OHF03321.1 hypothetical protein CORC01_01374 [Colletotrichum orchidophilum]
MCFQEPVILVAFGPFHVGRTAPPTLLLPHRSFGGGAALLVTVRLPSVPVPVLGHRPRLKSNHECGQTSQGRRSRGEGGRQASWGDMAPSARGLEATWAQT